MGYAARQIQEDKPTNKAGGESVSIDRTPVTWCPTPPVGCGKEVLVYNKYLGCWECPRCTVQVWTDGKTLTHVSAEERQKQEQQRLANQTALDAAEREQVLWSLSGIKRAKPVLPPGEPGNAKKSGNSRSGKRRKKPPKQRARRELEPWRDTK